MKYKACCCSCFVAAAAAAAGVCVCVCVCVCYFVLNKSYFLDVLSKAYCLPNEIYPCDQLSSRKVKWKGKL